MSNQIPLLQVFLNTVSKMLAHVGLDRQLMIDTETYRLYVHDGVTKGGHALRKYDDPTEDIRAIPFKGPDPEDGQIWVMGEWPSDEDESVMVPAYVAGELAYELTDDDISEGTETKGLISGMQLADEVISKSSLSDEEDTGVVTTAHNRQVNASYNAKASGGCSQVNASYQSTSSSSYTQVNSSYGSTSMGTCSQANTSNNAIASGSYSQVNSSTGGWARSQNSQVNSSNLVESYSSYSSVWGYAVTGLPSTSNQTIRLESNGGVGRFSGNVTTSGFDYAEYFPNFAEGEITNGTIVTLSAEKVKEAEAGDFILGVVSATAGVVGNSADFCWQGRYLVDEFGATVTESKEVVTFDGYHGFVSECEEEIPEDATYETLLLPVENPEYTDIGSDYSARATRKDEWTLVGLMGQVYVRVTEQLLEGDYVSAVGEKSLVETKLRVMKMTTEYDAAAGYGVAFCLLR